MKCPRCGAEMPVTRLFCDECGAQLEHEISEVEASVADEIRHERERATAKTVRWLLGVSILLFVAGMLFRRAYKDLPPNDIVAFVKPPTAALSPLETVVVSKFGLDLPTPPREPGIGRPRGEAAERRALDLAYRKAAVEVRSRGGKEPIEGLLVGDAAIEVIPQAGKSEVVGVAEIRSLKPLGDQKWQLTTIYHPKPRTVGIRAAAGLKILVLPRGADAPTAIPLLAITEIKPL